MLKITAFKNSLLARLLLVVAAFLIMVLSSSAVMYYTLNKKLLRNAEATMDDTQLLFSRILSEPETFLDLIAANIERMLNSGADIEAVKAYIDEASSQEFRSRIKTDYHRVYAYFDATDEFYDGLGWVPEAGFNPKERPWYKAAPESGEVGISEPFIDMDSSHRIISYSRRLYDSSGFYTGIAAIDVYIGSFRDMVINKRITPNSYGYMIDKNFLVIMHDNTSREGEFFWESNSATEPFKDLICEGKNISLKRSRNYAGTKSVVFGRQIYNNWYFALIIPEKEYYAELYSMIAVTGVLGAVLAAALIIMLINLEKARRKADEERIKKTMQLTEMEKEREADKRVRLMLDGAPFCIIFWNSELEVVDCNIEGVNLFGLSGKQELMDRWYDLSPEYQPDGRKSKDAIREVVEESRKKTNIRFEWMHRKLNGEEIPCEVTLITVKYKDTASLLGYIRDLREMKNILNELGEALNEAKIANKTKSSFLAQMSHEIRTPMNSIMGVTEILMEEDPPHNIANGLGIIYNSCDLLLGIINDILDFSKIEAGKMDIHPDIYFIASVINDSANLNMMRIGSKKIEFELSVDENLPAKMIGDELRIKQILNNILSNAFKYTNEGSVALSVSHEPIIKSTNDSFVKLILKVQDTGCGMTKEQVNNLFEEYTRFNQGKAYKVEGTGLGLAITLSLVELMDGEITVESELGMGSTFIVSIPQEVSGNETIGREVSENLRSFSLRHMDSGRKTGIVRDAMPYGRVLVVDDVETNLFVAKGLLRPYELQIDTAMSGFEAIEKIKKGSVYDLIFMDHMMPEMDGIETVNILRSTGYDEPIVALTANAVTGQSDIFLENGFDSFIAKPIDLRQLNAVLNKFIRDKQPPEIIEKYKNLATKVLNKKHDKEGPPELLNAKIEGLDITGGFEKFGDDTESYVKILRSYTAGVRSMKDKLELTGVDIDNHENIASMDAYRIAVHSIKGMSLDLLANEIGQKASSLEAAAKSGDLVYIKENNPVFLDNLLKLVSDIDNLLSKLTTVGSRGKPEKDKPDAETLSKLAAACKAYHMDSADAAMEDINKYHYTDDGGLAEWLQAQLDVMDFTAIVERLGG